MHTICTQPQEGDLGYNAKNYHQGIIFFLCNKATAVKSISNDNLNTKICKNNTNRTNAWDVILNTSNHFYIKNQQTIDYVNHHNFAIRFAIGDRLLRQIIRKVKGKEDHWLLNGLALKLNSS